jgi:ribonuclease HI
MLENSINSTNQSITIFTDGSCHTQLKTGGWASIILFQGEKIILEGDAENTTHQRMELTAVINSLEYLKSSKQIHEQINVYSDSQYVVDLLQRKERLASSNYLTKKLHPIRNVDLVKEVITFMGLQNIHFIKVKAHQRLSNMETLLNREVDLLSRKKMRK